MIIMMREIHVVALVIIVTLVVKAIPNVWGKDIIHVD